MTDELRDMARDLISQIDREAIFGSEDFGLHYELAEPIILAALLRAKEAGEREATERWTRLVQKAMDGDLGIHGPRAADEMRLIFGKMLGQDTGRG